MAMSVGTGGVTRAEINVTPLIDVVLVLLIIFMVITPLVQMGYDLQIPRKSETPVPVEHIDVDQVILSVIKDSALVRIYINKEEVQKDQLGARLGAIYKGKLDKLMFLSAGRDVNYGELMTIVDIARAAGGDSLKIGLVTEDKMSVGPASGA